MSREKETVICQEKKKTGICHEKNKSGACHQNRETEGKEIGEDQERQC